MPWKASSVVDERIRFVLEHESGLYTMTELCKAHDISRETGYVWVRRYRQGGLEALHDRNRVPRRHPNQTPEEIEAGVLELRREHMNWGPRKLKRVLERARSEQRWPAASTIGELLAREGLVVRRKKRQRTPPYSVPFATADYYEGNSRSTWNRSGHHRTSPQIPWHHLSHAEKQLALSTFPEFVLKDVA